MKRLPFGIVLEGLPSIGILAIATLAAAFLGVGFLTFILFLLLVFVCYFFRDPERVITYVEGSDIALCPADGRVISVYKSSDPLSGEEKVRVCIFMNIFNVHVNRSPVTGEVGEIKYIAGKFFNASWDKASTDNERCIYVLKSAIGQDWTFVQIAGLLARRIVPWVEKGSKLSAGERFGLIKFGSRVDIYLPTGYTPRVNVGDVTIAGQTILAEKSVNSQ